MSKLTDRAIANLKVTGERYEVWDDNLRAFGVRVGKTGTKSYVFLYHHEGRPRRLTLGRYPGLGLADAHVKLAEARKALDQGIDPGTIAVAEHRELRESSTVAELAADYIERDAKRNKASWREDRRIIDKDVLPRWKQRKAASITRRDVASLLNEIVDRGAGVQANRTYTVIRRMFRYGRNQGHVEANPCVDIDRPTVETPRDVILTTDEICSFWKGLRGADMTEGMRLILRLVLVTAQRKGEVANIEKADIDLDNAVWTIPAHKAKNRRTHLVPLNDLAVDLMRQAWERSGASHWLFPSPRGGGSKPVTGPAVDHAMRNNRVILGLVNVGQDGRELPSERTPTPHDLRRTAASQMTGSGIPRLHVDKLLNHIDASVGATYDRHDYSSEKRRAVDVWQARLEEIVAGQIQPSNVVHLASNAG